MENKQEAARNEAEKERLELEKKLLRIELIGSGACTAEGFETIYRAAECNRRPCAGRAARPDSASAEQSARLAVAS